MKPGDRALYYSFRDEEQVEVVVQKTYDGPMGAKMALVKRVRDGRLRDIAMFRLFLMESGNGDKQL